MQHEVEMFEMPPSFSDLLWWVNEKFECYFTLKWRFDSGKSSTHYVLLLLCNETHWLRYKMVVQGSNVTLLEVVVENGHRNDDLPSLDVVGSDEHEFRLHVEHHRAIWFWTLS